MLSHRPQRSLAIGPGVSPLADLPGPPEAITARLNREFLLNQIPIAYNVCGSTCKGGDGPWASLADVFQRLNF